MKKFLVVLCVLAVCSITLAEEQNSRRTRQPRSPGTSVADSNIPAKEKNAQEQKALRCYQQIGEVKKVEEQKKEEKPDNRNVIVDAWLVQVSADALYESGVKPLSEKDKENVSIMNLLWCLGDPNNGKVIASARTQANQNEKGYTSFGKTAYVTRGRGDGTQTSPYSSKVKFENICHIGQDKHIRMEYTFITETFKQDKITDTPPEPIYVNFISVITVAGDKPVIIAQTQIGDDMFFLVLRAEIVE